MRARQDEPGLLLRASGLRMRYGALEVLKGVDLVVREGETIAILGPNGAGKTSLFRLLSGEAFPSAGRIVYAGADVTRAAAFQRVRLGMGRTFQVARIFPDMTVVDNMTVAVERRRQGSGERPARWWRATPPGAIQAEVGDNLREVGLAADSDRLARVLSHGDKKRLELGLALALKPRLLMLDEPTAGMSPSDRLGAVALLGALKQRHGMTLLLTDHDMDVVFSLATTMVVLNYGEVIAAGAPQAVRDDPRVREVYLGHGQHA